MSIAALIRRMSELGAPAEAIALAVEAIETEQSKDKDRKAKRAAQKAAERARVKESDCRATVARQESDCRSKESPPMTVEPNPTTIEGNLTPKEKTPKGVQKKGARDELAEVLSPEMAAAVVEHRKTLRKPLTPTAAALLARKFAGCDDPNAGAAAMIENGWQGFEPAWLANVERRNRAPPDAPRVNTKLKFSNSRDDRNAKWNDALDRLTGVPSRQPDFLDGDYEVVSDGARRASGADGW